MQSQPTVTRIDIVYSIPVSFNSYTTKLEERVIDVTNATTAFIAAHINFLDHYNIDWEYRHTYD